MIYMCYVSVANSKFFFILLYTSHSFLNISIVVRINGFYLFKIKILTVRHNLTYTQHTFIDSTKIIYKTKTQNNLLYLYKYNDDIINELAQKKTFFIFV